MKSQKKEGVIGALLDEYKYALEDLKKHLDDIKDEELPLMVNKNADHEDFISILSVLTHVIYLGKYYIVMIDVDRGNAKSKWPEGKYFNTVDEYKKVLDKLYDLNEEFFENVDESEMDEDPAKKFDYQDLMQHAIVHIYRHRRQIRKFKESLK